jgi:hypothetical protein
MAALCLRQVLSDDVALDGRILQEDPGFVDEESFERSRTNGVSDHGIGAMEDIEEQRFEKVRVLTHLLKVETLEPRERNRVLRVVEQEPELTSTDPFGEARRKRLGQSVREDPQPSQFRIHGIQVLNLFVNIAIGDRVELERAFALQQDFHKQSQEVEILLGRREGERIDRKALGFEPSRDVRSGEKMCEAFKAAAEIENEGVRVILLEIGDQEVQQKGLSGAGAAENHGVRDVLVMEIQKVRSVVAGFEDREILLPEMGIAGFAAGERK